MYSWEKLQDLSENEIEIKIKAILSKMTIKEKAYIMNGDRGLFGGLSLLRYCDPPIPAGAIKRLGIPPFRFVDGPRGIVAGNSTCFPVSMARGAAWDIDLEERIGDVIGIEGRAHGATYFGGVCINLLRHPAWGRAQETYGEDPYHLGMMGSALTKGVQKHMMACAKHFALNSMENMRFKVDVSIDERSLREIYLKHFKMCVDAGLASLMGAYNKLNGHQCCEHTHLQRNIAKGEWGFKGFIISDFIFGVKNGIKAINAGLDVEMPLSLKMSPRKIVKWQKEGKIKESDMDDSAARILRQKLKFNRSYDPELYSLARVTSAEYRETAKALPREAAQKGMVLLKNQDNILPLNRDKLKTLAVVGRLADYENTGDHGSSRVHPVHVVTPYSGIKKIAGPSVKVIYNEGKNIKKLKDIASKVDVVVVVVGTTYKEEGEFLTSAFPLGGDRAPISLDSKQEQLINHVAAVNKKVIVIMESGSAVITERWRNNVQGIIMAWYAGMEGGLAMGDIIFGDINPSGKLPCVFPKSEEQLPFFDKQAVEITYDYYHGYTLMDRDNHTPAFAFGFGLSFTNYSYSNLILDKETIPKDGILYVSVDVTNNGNMSGEEIVQMYIGYKNSSVERHVKDLRGFGKLSLKPGETKTMTMKLRAEDVAYYDVETKSWKVEEIEYIVYVGPCSTMEDLLTATFTVY